MGDILLYQADQLTVVDITDGVYSLHCPSYMRIVKAEEGWLTAMLANGDLVKS